MVGGRIATSPPWAGHAHRLREVEITAVVTVPIKLKEVCRRQLPHPTPELPCRSLHRRLRLFILLTGMQRMDPIIGTNISSSSSRSTIPSNSWERRRLEQALRSTDTRCNLPVPGALIHHHHRRTVWQDHRISTILRRWDRSLVIIVHHHRPFAFNTLLHPQNRGHPKSIRSPQKQQRPRSQRLQRLPLLLIQTPDRSMLMLFMDVLALAQASTIPYTVGTSPDQSVLAL